MVHTSHNDLVGRKLIVPPLPIFIDFSKRWHLELLDISDVKAEIVDLKAEGIQALEDGIDLHNREALKITINPNETKYIRIPITSFSHGVNVSIHLYLTGTVTARLIGADVGTHPVSEHQDQWTWMATRSSQYWGVALELKGGSDGGACYIKDIAIWSVEQEGEQEISSFPNPTLDGATTYQYDLKFLAMDGRLNGSVVIAGDGTNPITVELYVRTPDGDKKIWSVSRTDSTPAVYTFGFPVKYLRIQSNYPFMYAYIKVSGYGRFVSYSVRLRRQEVTFDKIGGRKTNSASNTSTTVAVYDLFRSNGYVSRFYNAKVDLDGTYGTAKLYINGQLVLDASGTTATFNIPSDWEIYRIHVELAGDGTNPATASFEGLEVIGPYVMSL